MGARTGLPDDQREVIIKFAFDHLIGNLDNGLADFRVEFAERDVGFGGSLLDDAECSNDRLWLALPTNLEVAT